MVGVILALETAIRQWDADTDEDLAAAGIDVRDTLDGTRWQATDIR